MGGENDSDAEEAAVQRIAQQTARMLEARRKRENARRMAKMMRTFRQEQQQLSHQQAEDPVETQVEVELDDAEALRLQRLQSAVDELAGEGSPGEDRDQDRDRERPAEPPAKYEAPLVARLRTLETVEELYQLADVIVPLKTR